MAKVFLIVLALALWACGDASSPTEPVTEVDVTQQDKSSYSLDLAVPKTTDLPECLEQFNNKMAYIIDSKKFFVCQEKNWKEIRVSQGEQGPAGDACYETTGDSNEDGVLSVEDCVGKDGQDGISCWEATGDSNGDGEFTAEDCVGQQGLPGKDGESIVGPAGKDGESIVGPAGKDGESIVGPQGLPGKDGESIVGPQGLPGKDGESIVGPAGKDGKNCWEDVGDVNQDGILSSLDCVGAAGKDGESIVGPQGSPGKDGESIVGPAGEDGESIVGPAGKDGKNCWEDVGDVNGDGTFSSLDCVGPQGLPGRDGSDGRDGESIVGPQGVQGESGEDNHLIRKKRCSGLMKHIVSASPYWGEFVVFYLSSGDIMTQSAWYSYPSGGSKTLLKNSMVEMYARGTAWAVTSPSEIYWDQYNTSNGGKYVFRFLNDGRAAAIYVDTETPEYVNIFSCVTEYAE